MRLSFGITSKLFVALFALSMVVALAMGAAVRWRFDANFLDYVNAREAERMAVFAQSIESAYAEHGSWDFLRDDRQAWHRLIRREIGRTRTGPFADAHGEAAEPVPPFGPPPGDPPPGGVPPGGMPPGPPPDAGGRPPLHPPGEGPGMHPPIWLLDAGRTPIAGDGPPPGPGSQWHALHHNGLTVGWLAVPQRQHVPEGADQAFLAQQLRATWIIAALSVLLAAGVAILLARGVLAPMRRLAHATRRMAEGDYAARVDEVRSRDEIGRLAGDFNRLAETLEANQKMRRQLTADISHELRTPLAVLRGELEALEDGVRALTPASLTSLQAEVSTLSKLIDDLYELSLADVGALAFHMQSIDLADTVCSAAQGFTSRLMEKSIALQLDLPTGPSRDATIQGDAQRLRQLMQNLLENTLRYTDAGGTLRIRVHRDGAWWCLDVQDSAPGVPEAMLPRVFDRLFRADPSRSRAQGGAGLGLSLCQTIVQTHGGTIEARPSPLGGLWIAIRLPAANSSVADHDPDR
ncbi:MULTISPECIES: ATP-binding protein [Ralstonia solanacearum species complex]|uniref:histidine kinase n=1 Tax=Ralstonia syzygii TaxID=28097 RepID=A0ABX7ZPW4_9RALS|nr:MULTISPECIES: ATP-binding protein [Ralstonia solanacearum species complex]AMP40123.1 two-component sensor histidine kinase [Ralstonia solanacearum]AXV88974.1 two-component sensor histidine kinase [Ralstonia solanacearum]AXW08441.1 two-component sensor histidine kinase [Ralstonia solanacearum]AXW26228.1 two-component sensor histidine kinase [Ralstonia solanacearum]AXW83140.1 two-component sensor histidine kinase [Ralstonia solanacearum]